MESLFEKNHSNNPVSKINSTISSEINGTFKAINNITKKRDIDEILSDLELAEKLNDITKVNELEDELRNALSYTKEDIAYMVPVESSNSIKIHIGNAEGIVTNEFQIEAQKLYNKELNKKNIFIKPLYHFFYKTNRIEKITDELKINKKNLVSNNKYNYAVANTAKNTSVNYIPNKELDDIINRYINNKSSKQELLQVFEKITSENYDIESLSSDVMIIIEQYKRLKMFLVNYKDGYSISDSKKVLLEEFLFNKEFGQSNRSILESELGFIVNRDTFDIIYDRLNNYDIVNTIIKKKYKVELGVLNDISTPISIDYDKQNNIVDQKTNTPEYKTGRIIERNPKKMAAATATIMGLFSFTGPIFGRLLGSSVMGYLASSKTSYEYTQNHKTMQQEITDGNYLKSNINKQIEALEKQKNSKNPLKKLFINKKLLELKLYEKNRKINNYVDFANIQKKDYDQAYVKLYKAGAPHKHLIIPLTTYLKNISNYDTNLSKKFFIQENNNGSMHLFFSSAKNISNGIQKNLLKIHNELDIKHKNKVTSWLTQGLVLLDISDKTGQSLFRGKGDMQQDIYELNESIDKGLRVIDSDKDQIRASALYHKIHERITGNLRSSHENFKQERIKEMRKSALYGSGSYLAISGIFHAVGQFFRNINLPSIKISGPETTSFSTQTEVTPNTNKPVLETLIRTKTVFNEAFTDEAIQNLELKNLDTIDFYKNLGQDTLRESLKQTYGEQKGNEIKNQILNHILEATNENGESKLFNLANIDNSVINDFATNNPNSETIIQKLQLYGYNDLDKHSIYNQLLSLSEGTYDINHYSDRNNRIIAEILFEYINEGDKGVLYDIIFEDKEFTIKAPIETNQIQEESILPMNSQSNTDQVNQTQKLHKFWKYFSNFGIGLFRNIYLDKKNDMSKK